MSNLTLGQRVSFCAHVKSKHRSVAEKSPHSYDWLVVKTVVERTELRESKTGIVVGIRVLREGKVCGGLANDDPTYLETTNTVKVYLVAVNLSGFYRVLPEDITPVKEAPHA